MQPMLTHVAGVDARVKNRVQKILKDGNMKWSSIVSDVFCPAGMAL